ncbi:MAG TPA: hypothetical protein DCE56_10710 [Cyanobacteria bacterium UBA8553]|nr:hypothetical protein [Cyanobacteria bacterium UBA8553]
MAPHFPPKYLRCRCQFRKLEPSSAGTHTSRKNLTWIYPYSAALHGGAIALTYVLTQLSKIKQQLEIDIRGKAYPATVVKKPFYRSKNRPS